MGDGNRRAQFCKPRCCRNAWPRHKARRQVAAAQADQAAAEVSEFAADVQEILEGRIFVTQPAGMKDSDGLRSSEPLRFFN